MSRAKETLITMATYYNAHSYMGEVNSSWCGCQLVLATAVQAVPGASVTFT